MSSSFISLGAALHSFMPSAVRIHGKHKRSRSMPTSRVHPIVADFQCQLQAKLEILIQQQQQQRGSYNISTAWLGQALDVVLFIYSSLKELYPHIMPIDSNADGKWLSRHMEDLVNLLDVCNVLKECMSEIKKNNMSVQIALHGLLQVYSHAMMSNQVLKAKNSLANCMDELKKNKDMESKLANCMSTLKRMADSLPPTTATATISMDRSSVEEVIKEAKAITIFVCTALVASLSFNAPCRSFMPAAGFLKTKKKISTLPHHMDINSMTNMMQQKLKEAMEMQRKRSSSFKFLLQELNRVDVTVGNINNLLDRYIKNKMSKLSSNMQDELKDSIDAVSMSTTELESALIHIDQRMNELFRFLISSRVALLNSVSNLSS